MKTFYAIICLILAAFIYAVVTLPVPDNTYFPRVITAQTSVNHFQKRLKREYGPRELNVKPYHTLDSHNRSVGPSNAIYGSMVIGAESIGSRTKNSAPGDTFNKIISLTRGNVTYGAPLISLLHIPNANLQGSPSYYNTEDTLIYTYNLNGNTAICDRINFYNNTLNFSFYDVYFARTVFGGVSKISGDIDNMQVYDSKFDRCYFENGIRDTLILLDVTVDNLVSMRMPKYVYISNIKGVGRLELSPKWPGDLGPYTLELDSAYLHRISFPDNAKIIVNERLDYKRKVALYKQILALYENDYNRKKDYDIEFQKLVNYENDRYLTDWVEEHWWNYGYDKNLIFRNSIVFWVSFILINYLIGFQKLLYKGYKLSKFVKADKRVQKKYPFEIEGEFYRFIYCIFYTSYIFWGLKLSLDKIELGNLRLTVWIVIQYIAGIICLAYIANIVITKS